MTSVSQYHAKSLGLLGISAALDPMPARNIGEFEQHYAVILPPAVREWHSLRDRKRVFKLLDNDPFVELSLGGDDDDSWREFLQNQLLPIRNENQGVCQWLVELNGSPDPPVVVEIEGEEAVSCEVSFSEFIFSCCWEMAHLWRPEQLVMANTEPIRPTQLQSIERRLSNVVNSSGWPGDRQLRLEREGICLMLWLSKDQTDWFGSAVNKDDLELLLALYDEVGVKPAALYSHDVETERRLRDRD